MRRTRLRGNKGDFKGKEFPLDYLLASEFQRNSDAKR